MLGLLFDLDQTFVSGIESHGFCTISHWSIFVAGICVLVYLDGLNSSELRDVGTSLIS